MRTEVTLLAVALVLIAGCESAPFVQLRQLAPPSAEPAAGLRVRVLHRGGRHLNLEAYGGTIAVTGSVPASSQCLSTDSRAIRTIDMIAFPQATEMTIVASLYRLPKGDEDSSPGTGCPAGLPDASGSLLVSSTVPATEDAAVGDSGGTDGRDAATDADADAAADPDTGAISDGGGMEGDAVAGDAATDASVSSEAGS